MPKLKLREDDEISVKSNDSSQNNKKKNRNDAHPFWGAVARDILSPFAPRIPALIQRKYLNVKEKDINKAKGIPINLSFLLTGYFYTRGV